MDLVDIWMKLVMVNGLALSIEIIGPHYLMVFILSG